MILKSLTALAALATAAGFASADTDDKKALGWLEHVRIMDLDIELDAKLDTGATTSSIHAVILSKPDRKKWDDEDESKDIIFKVINEDGDERTIETEIVRWAAIKTKKGGVIYRRSEILPRWRSGQRGGNPSRPCPLQLRNANRQKYA